ncbi:MAG TPA: GGDEF domain-containing phosphodiesterase, partial [Lachnospiraceae bacterium]|nr:GGDEF domain-containing phosphodiesterase [Lachnospiraceae bacterium]
MEKGRVKIKEAYTKKRKLLFDGLTVLLLAAIAALIFYQYFGVSYEDVRIRGNSIDCFGEGFVSEETGAGLSDFPVCLKRGESITITKQLPDEIGQDEVLSFLNNGFSVEAFVDEEPVYQYGLANAAEFGKETGQLWNYISLQETMAGRQLTIRLYAYADRAYLGSSSFYIGSTGAMDMYILKMNFCVLFGTVLIVLVSVLFLIYSFYLKKKSLPGEKLFLYAGTFSLLFAVWIFADSTLVQFFTGKMTARYLVSCYAFMLMFLPLLLLFREGCVAHKIWLDLLQMLFGTAFVACTVLYAAKVMPLSESLFLFYFLVAAAFISAVIITVNEYRTYHNKAIIEPFVVLAILIVAGTGEIAARYAGTVTDSSPVFRCGLLLFVLFFFITILRRSFMILRKNMMAEYYKKLAFVDAVTKGNTQQYFEEMVPKQLENGINYGVVYFDIISFKMVNDDVGRTEGNHVLREMYQSLSNGIGAHEILAHAGGAHFIMLLENSRVWDISMRLYNMKKAINQLPVGQMKKNQISVCAGIYLAGHEKLSVSQMIDRAIMARNEDDIEIINGFGCKIYSDEIRLRMVRENALKNRMLQGMEKGEFKVYLQPKVLLMTGRVSAAEALARWEDPKEGMIFPAEFIPIFENNGAIIRMNLYMLRGVLDILKDWLKRGITPVVISVNLSKISIHNPIFMSEFSKIMEDPATPARYLEFEFTENAAYENPAKLNALIEQIHEWGATCSIDDFGCSYSNLNMLKDVPVDVLKLDKEFFGYEQKNKAKAFKIIESIIRLTHDIGMEIVAEGVEDESQVAFLKEIDCDMIQCFYHSKPLS